MQNFYLKFIWLGFLWLVFFPVYAQNKKMTVEESIRLGLEYNSRLNAASADTEVAQATYRQAKTERRPLVRGQASYMRLSNNIPNVDFAFPEIDTTFTLLPVELNQFYSEISVRQLLFAGGRLNRQIKAAGHYADAAVLLEKQEKADVAFQIRRAYWELYQATVVNRTVKTALLMVEEHIQNVQNKVEEGVMLRTDLLNAEVRYSEVLLDQVETKNKLKVARLQLNRLMGQDGDLEVEVVGPGEPVPVFFGGQDLVEQTIEQRPGLNALSEQVMARETEVETTKSQRLPTISLVGKYVYARPNQYFFAQQDQFRGTWEAGVALQWDIWAGGKRIIETSIARAQLRGAEANLADMKEQITLEVAKNSLELERSLEAIEMATKGVESAEEAFLMTRNLFDEGVVLSKQVLDAEHSYRKAQANYARAVADFKIAQAAVLQVMGQIWGSDEL